MFRVFPESGTQVRVSGLDRGPRPGPETTGGTGVYGCRRHLTRPQVLARTQPPSDGPGVHQSVTPSECYFCPPHLNPGVDGSESPVSPDVSGKTKLCAPSTTTLPCTVAVVRPSGEPTGVVDGRYGRLGVVRRPSNVGGSVYSCVCLCRGCCRGRSLLCRRPTRTVRERGPLWEEG